MDKGGQLAANLVRAKWAFDFSLVITDHIEGIICDLPDTVQHKNTFVAAIQNDISAFKRRKVSALNAGFITSRNEERIHAVALWFDFNCLSISKQLLNVDGKMCGRYRFIV